MIKKGLLCLIASSVFSVLWILLLNVFEPLRSKNYEFVTFLVFIAVSICIALICATEYLKQKDKIILKKIGIVTIVATLSFAVIIGVFYLTIFGVLYHNYP